MIRLLPYLLAVLVLMTAGIAKAATQQQTVETIWRLLDYVAVDYAGAVNGGRVISDVEFAEMREFSETARRNMATLAAKPAKAALLDRAGALSLAVQAKRSPDEVARLARALAASLVEAYPVPLAPREIPDLARGAALYQERCASCHGATGMGNGPAASGLDPAPVDFTARERARQRSIFALEQVIAQGLDGTAMASFRDLSSEDRWALAFHAGGFAYPAPLIAKGKRLWQSEPGLARKIPDLKTLVSLTPQALASEIGEEKAAAVTAYLRSSPQVPGQGGPRTLTIARARLVQSVAAYRDGSAEQAERLALSAYLDGFEQLEPLLGARDRPLVRKIERAMAGLRVAITQRKTIQEVEAEATTLTGLFDEAERTLAEPANSGISTFLSALTILLREGVEALLVVVAMLTFLRKSNREDALPYVHGGWIAALLAGVLTWVVATRFLAISGTSRELTEGFGGILAAIVLVSVGIWMHGKSQADAWQLYIRRRMSKALTKGSAWFLFGLAFLVVYREAFETVLFYAAMWSEGAKMELLAGAAAGAVLLCAIAWAMIRYSLRLPIAQFFRYSSILIAVLAIVLAGKGIAALQEAGFLGVTPVDTIPRIDVLGLYPTAQVVAAQVLVALTLFVGFWMNARASRGIRPSSPDT